jgi:hypothetical protein
MLARCEFDVWGLLVSGECEVLAVLSLFLDESDVRFENVGRAPLGDVAENEDDDRLWESVGECGRCCS